MKLAGVCPSCSNGIRFSIKEKIRGKLKCPNCETMIQPDPKRTAAFSFALILTVLVTYPIDWRLSLLAAIIIRGVGLVKIQYRVVE